RAAETIPTRTHGAAAPARLTAAPSTPSTETAACRTRRASHRLAPRARATTGRNDLWLLDSVDGQLTIRRPRRPPPRKRATRLPRGTPRPARRPARRPRAGAAAREPAARRARSPRPTRTPRRRRRRARARASRGEPARRA